MPLAIEAGTVFEAIWRSVGPFPRLALLGSDWLSRSGNVRQKRFSWCAPAPFSGCFANSPRQISPSQEVVLFCHSQCIVERRNDLSPRHCPVLVRSEVDSPEEGE